MKNLITNLFQSSVSGPLFLMLTGSLLYLLRSIPKTVLDGVLWCFTVKLTISGQDEVFDWVSDWLGEHVYSKKSRVLKLSTGKGAQSSWVLSPGFGIHFFWDKEHGLVVEFNDASNTTLDEVLGALDVATSMAMSDESAS